MRRDESVFVMGENVGVFRAFKVTEGLLDEFGEKRIATRRSPENTIVGVGVGAAMAGLLRWWNDDDRELFASGPRPDRQPRGGDPHVQTGTCGCRWDCTCSAGRPPARPHPLTPASRPSPPGAGLLVACPSTPAVDAKALLGVDPG